MKIGRQTAVAFCPDCEEQIHMGTDPELGLKVLCPHCWTDLEVISLKPLKLSWDIGQDEEEKNLIREAMGK
jgi:lysine biosynthesis protein LysW